MQYNVRGYVCVRARGRRLRVYLRAFEVPLRQPPRLPAAGRRYRECVIQRAVTGKLSGKPPYGEIGGRHED